MSLESYLLELGAEDKPVKHAGLVRLSGLAAEEMEQFRRAWSALGVERRRQILARLVEMAENNVEMDFQAVFHHCLRDPDDQVREKALAGLWECNDRSLIGSLIDLLHNDPAENVRAAAALALGNFASLAEDGKILSRDGERIWEALIRVIKENRGSPGVRRRAIEAIAPFNTAGVREIIEEAYHDEDAQLRCSAVFAMGRSCDARWLPVIFKELASPAPPMRYEAANACGAMGEEEAVPYLVPLTKDDDIEVQRSAIHALGAIGGRVARRVLLGCARDGDDVVREAATEALQLMESEEDPLAFRFGL